MAKQDIIEIHGFSDNSMAYYEAKGLSLILAAYANNCPSEPIESIGFNPNSGYTWLALENGVQIVSSIGQAIEYLTTHPEDGCEHFFDTYEEALNSDFLQNELDC